MKRIVSMILVMSVLSSTFAFASTMDIPTTPAEAKSMGVQVVHKDAITKVGGIGTLDVNPGWTENVEMRLSTSTHFQMLVVTTVATVLAARFGGKNADWKGAAVAIVGGSATIESNNVYQKVRYYWQTSGDPSLPYYVKQVTYNYSDQARTKLLHLNNRYYYSNLPF